jgi:hypothetical protein
MNKHLEDLSAVSRTVLVSELNALKKYSSLNAADIEYWDRLQAEINIRIENECINDEVPIMPNTAGSNFDKWSHGALKIILLKALDVKVGDFLEHPSLQVYRVVKSIDKQYGRLYFIFGDSTPRTCLVDDLVMVGLADGQEVR